MLPDEIIPNDACVRGYSLFVTYLSNPVIFVTISLTDGTRRAASKIARNSTVGTSCNARQSIDAAYQDGGFKSANEESSTRRAGVRFEVNNKVNNEAEERASNAFLLVEDGNANLRSPDTSSLQTSLRSEDEDIKKINGEYSPLDESYDSVL